MYTLAIVDDEQLILNGLRDHYLWQEMGFEIILTATHGSEIKEFIENGGAIDVLLCDIAMPEVTGIDLAEYIYTNKVETTIVFLTGYADFDFAKKAIQYGVFEYLLKPVKYDELVKTFSRIRSLFDKSRGVTNLENAERILIDRIHKIAESNLSTITWKSIASEIGLSQSYLSSLYKKLEGRSFSDYLLETKMNLAKKYLSECNLRIYEIACRLGYSNPKNFTRAFKAFFGKSPRSFRTGGNGDED